jgi:hypothetical protein
MHHDWLHRGAGVRWQHSNLSADVTQQHKQKQQQQLLRQLHNGAAAATAVNVAWEVAARDHSKLFLHRHADSSNVYHTYHSFIN